MKEVRRLLDHLLATPNRGRVFPKKVFSMECLRGRETFLPLYVLKTWIVVSFYLRRGLLDQV